MKTRPLTAAVSKPTAIAIRAGGAQARDAARHTHNASRDVEDALAALSGAPTRPELDLQREQLGQMLMLLRSSRDRLNEYRRANEAGRTCRQRRTHGLVRVVLAV
jgi:hypothetical protein